MPELPDLVHVEAGLRAAVVGKRIASARTGDPLTCRLVYEVSRALEDVVFTVSFNWPSGYLCTQISSGAGANLEAGPGEVEFTIPLLVMQRGLYSVDVAISRGGERLDWRPRCSLLRVDPGRIIAGDFAGRSAGFRKR